MAEPAAESLAERVRRRDTAALAEFLEARRPALLAFAAGRLGATLRGKLEPEDIVQELAVRALQQLPAADLTEREPFAWLCHLAEQCVVDGHRRFAASKRAAGREVPANAPQGDGSQDLAAMLAASITSPSLAAVRGERERRLEAALAGLPPDHRELLRLRYGEGLPTREIAARLGKADAAVRAMLSRVVERLQELLGSGDSA